MFIKYFTDDRVAFDLHLTWQQDVLEDAARFPSNRYMLTFNR